MRKRILFLALVVLLVLPVPGITQNVEIESVNIKWIETGRGGADFRAKIWVGNYADTVCLAIGALIFYDRDGYEIYKRLFSGKVEAGESVAFHCRGFLSKDQYEDMGSYEAIIMSPRPTRR